MLPKYFKLTAVNSTGETIVAAAILAHFVRAQGMLESDTVLFEGGYLAMAAQNNWDPQQTDLVVNAADLANTGNATSAVQAGGGNSAMLCAIQATFPALSAGNLDIYLDSFVDAAGANGDDPGLGTKVCTLVAAGAATVQKTFLVD